MPRQSVSRRAVLTGGLSAVALLVAACAAPPAPTSTPAPAKPAAPTEAPKPAAPAEAPKPAQPTEAPKPAAAPPTPVSAAKPAAAGVTKLQMTSWDAPSPVLTEFLGAFDSKQNTQTEYVHIPFAGYRDKILTMLAGGVPPDVMLVGATETAEYASRNQLLALDANIQRDKFDLQDFFEPALDAGRWKGKQYGIGDNFVYRILFYNLDLFAAAGVPRPPSEWTNQTWKWDTFLDAATKLTKKDAGGRTTQYGFAVGLNAVNAMSWVWSNGGEWVDPNLSKVDIGEPPAVEALQFLQDLQYKHGVTPTPDALAAENMAQMAAGGKVAMWWDGPWSFAALRQVANLKWDVAPIPAGKKGAFSTAAGATWSIAAPSKQQETAWKLLDQLVSREGQLSMIKRFGFPGSRKSITNSPAFLDLRPPEHTSVAAEGGTYARALPKMVNFNEASKAFNDGLAFLNNNTKTGAEVAQLVKERVTPLLAQAQG
jgi:multiple sugar transport system substrate-binding protein